MAPTAVDPFTDTALKIVRLLLDELDEVAEEWDALGEGERVAWSLAWGNEMARLRHLRRQADAGVLTPYQRALLTDILSRLAERRPRVVHLGLETPEGADAPSVAAAEVGNRQAHR